MPILFLTSIPDINDTTVEIRAIIIADDINERITLLAPNNTGNMGINDPII